MGFDIIAVRMLEKLENMVRGHQRTLTRVHRVILFLVCMGSSSRNFERTATHRAYIARCRTMLFKGLIECSLVDSCLKLVTL